MGTASSRAAARADIASLQSARTRSRNLPVFHLVVQTVGGWGGEAPSEGS